MNDGLTHMDNQFHTEYKRFTDSLPDLFKELKPDHDDYLPRAGKVYSNLDQETQLQRVPGEEEMKAEQGVRRVNGELQKGWNEGSPLGKQVAASMFMLQTELSKEQRIHMFQHIARVRVRPQDLAIPIFPSQL